jgi:hypothetical protein
MEAQACNPSYMGGRNQEDHSSRPTRTKSSQDSILTNVWAWCTHLSSQLYWEAQLKDYNSGQPGHKGRPYLKITSTKKAAEWL